MKKSIGIILIIGIVLTLVLLIGILPSVSDYQAMQTSELFQSISMMGELHMVPEAAEL